MQLARTKGSDAAPARAASAAVSACDVTRRYGEGENAVEALRGVTLEGPAGGVPAVGGPPGALRGVTLEVPAGQFTAVMGPSGSGKSTLMHILAGLDQPTSGSVWIGEKEISSMGDKELTQLRRDNVGFIFQFFNLLPMLNAEENITLPLSIAGRKPEKEWLEAVLAEVGLVDRRDHRPSELSGGQQQRVAVARALISRPTVLFADEPTGNLDSHTSEGILQLLRESVDRYGQTTLMVTHDPAAAAIADRVVHLDDGIIVDDVTPAQGGGAR